MEKSENFNHDVDTENLENVQVKEAVKVKNVTVAAVQNALIC